MPALRDLLFVATAAPDDDQQRDLATRSTVAIVAVGFCLSLACAFTMPILFGTDERVHLAYVEVVLDGDLPEIDSDVPLDGHFQVLVEYYAGDVVTPGPYGDVWVANHPPLAYLLAAPPAWLGASLGYDRGPPMTMRVLCALGMAVGALATAAVADALLPGRRRTAVLAAGLVALAPAIVSIGSYGYNDGLALAVGTALLAVVLRVARWGPTRGRLVGLVALGTAAILSRSALLPLVPLGAGVWMWCTWRSEPRRALGGAAVAAVVPAVLGGWFYLRNIELYGSFSGSGHLQEKFGRTDAGSTAELLLHPRFLLGSWQDLWGAFRSNAGLGTGHSQVGSPDAELGSRLVIGGALVALAAAGWFVGALRTVRRRGRPSITWGVAAAWVGVCVVGLASFVSGGGSPHPRYLFPALPVLAVVLVAGVGHLPRGRTLAASVVVAIGAVDLLLYAKLSVFFTTVSFPERFSQPAWSSWVVLGALGAALGGAAIATTALRAVDDDPTSPDGLRG